MIGLKRGGGKRWRGGEVERWRGGEVIQIKELQSISSSFIWVDEHENVGRLHNLLCHIRLRPNPAKPSIKKNLNWQQALPNLVRVGVVSGGSLPWWQ